MECGDAKASGYGGPSVAIVLASLLVFFAATSAEAVKVVHAAGKTGVVIEHLSDDSTLSRGGIRPGDCLTSWKKQHNQSWRRINSVFSWMRLEIEEAPRGDVVLSGKRNGKNIIFLISPGPWEATVRPEMSDRLVKLYERGGEAWRSGHGGQGALLWQTISSSGERELGELPCWIWLRTAEQWLRVQRWREMDVANRRALEAAHTTEARVVVWNAIAAAHERRGELPAAEKAYRSAAAIQLARFGRGLWFAASQGYLATVAVDRGNLRTATHLRRTALSLQARLAPGSLQSESLSWLGHLALAAGSSNEAEQYFDRARVYRQQIAPGGLDWAESLYDFGSLALQRGELAKAESQFQSSLEIRERLAPGSRKTGKSLVALGMVAFFRGDLEGAERLWQQALDIQQVQAPGLEVATVLNNLGEVSRLRGDLALAEDRQELALHITQAIAPGSLDVAFNLNNLGLIATDRGDFATALDFHRRALKIRESRFGGKFDAAGSLVSLAAVSFHLKDLKAAENYQRRSSGVLRRELSSSWQSRRIP